MASILSNRVNTGSDGFEPGSRHLVAAKISTTNAPREHRILQSPTDKRRVNWIPDEKVSNCAGCGEAFSFSLRKHHCRSCGQIFCWKCSEKRIDLSKLGYTGPQRVCDSCYNNFQKDSRTLDDALATVQLLMRDLPFFAFHEGLFSIGRRGPPAKLYSGVKVQGNRDEVFCFSVIQMNEDFAPIFKLDSTRKLFSSLMKETISHPYIAEVVFAQLFEKKIAVARHMYPSGSLRDFMHGKVNPRANYVEKYETPAKPLPLHLIQRLGKQVLDALFYLYLHGFPYPHLHAGNVLINGENVCLSDLENSLVGVMPFYAQHMMENKNILQPEVLCFGQLLFFMAIGQERAPERKIAAFKDQCPPEVYEVLELIFETKDPQEAPSLKTLLKHSFFAAVKGEVKIHKSVLAEEWDEKVRSTLKLVRTMIPKSINPSAQLSMKRAPSSTSVDSISKRASTTGLSLSSSSGQLVSPRGSTQTSQTSPPPARPTSPPPARATSPPPPPPSSSSSSHQRSKSSTSTVPAAPSAGGPAPPPPPPPPSKTTAPAPADLPPPQEGRNALLDAIRGNNMSRLKKTGGPSKNR